MNDSSNFKVRTAGFALLCVVLYFVLQAFVLEVKAFMLAMAVGVLYIVASERWQLRKRARFWAVMVLLGFVNVSTILLLNPLRLAGPSLLVWPMMIADCWLGLFILDRVVTRSDDHGIA